VGTGVAGGLSSIALAVPCIAARLNLVYIYRERNLRGLLKVTTVPFSLRNMCLLCLVAVLLRNMFFVFRLPIILDLRLRRMYMDGVIIIVML
jgi:hypothetical protein